MFENVDRRRPDAGRRSHWYTISSPMSLSSDELKMIKFAECTNVTTNNGSNVTCASHGGPQKCMI